MNDTIELKGIIWEDTVNYKKISTTLMFPKCSFKCDKENGVQLCQNWSLAAAPSQKVNVMSLLDTYLGNPLTEALVFQGLEPFDSPIDLRIVSASLNTLGIKDDVVIYTGYDKYEISQNLLHYLKETIPGHLIIKWGRYRPNQEEHFDKNLGVYLASNNQYGEIIK